LRIAEMFYHTNLKPFFFRFLCSINFWKEKNLHPGSPVSCPPPCAGCRPGTQNSCSSPPAWPTRNYGEETKTKVVVFKRLKGSSKGGSMDGVLVIHARLDVI
jgi:hypothetical protein